MKGRAPGGPPHQRYLKAEFLTTSLKTPFDMMFQYGQLLAGIGGRLDRGHG
jgi:hypothetical protein